MIDKHNISNILRMLKEYIRQFSDPAVERVGHRDPFRVLVSGIISARTKDNVTRAAAKRLLDVVKSPYDLVKIGEDMIAELIYPTGFYRSKAKSLTELSKTLIDRFKGQVPDNIDELLSLKGVGRKIANLTIILGFDKYGICVDTHVHRIVNRWGYLETRTPLETEMMLRKSLPKKHWKEINRILVTFGKNVCKPIGPLCRICPISVFCEKRIVTKGKKNHRLSGKSPSS